MNQGPLKPIRKDFLKPESSSKYHSKDFSLSKQDSQAKFKTELCRNLDSGFCEFGEKCFFAHSVEELREKNQVGLLKHLKCKGFFESGYCMNGLRCQFSHRDISPETSANSPNISGKVSRKGSDDLNRQVFVDLEFRSLF